MEFESCLSAFSTPEAIRWIDPPCQIQGIAAPLFLWTASAVLILFTASFALKFLLEAGPLISRFRRLKREIDAIPPQGQPLDGAGLERLGEMLRNDRLLAAQWNEFEETLLFEQTRDQVKHVFTTRRASECFDEEGVIEARVNTKFYVALPGILTSVGLLLTFTAILIGLGHIKQVDGKLTGVEELVYSLSGKFITSIAALILATLFTFLEKRIMKTLHRTYRAFLGTLDRRFQGMPAEHLLQIIHIDIHQQARLSRQILANLPGQLKQSLREGLDPLTTQIATALEEIVRQKDESLSDSLDRILGEFKSTLRGSTNTELQALASTLGSTASTLEAMNRQSEKSQAVMNELLRGIETMIARQAETGKESLSRLVHVMEGMLAKLRETTSASSQSLTGAVGEVLQRLEQSSNTQLLDNTRRSEELSELVKGLMMQTQQSIQLSSDSLKSTVSNVVETTTNWSSLTVSKMIELLEQQNNNATTIEGVRNSLGKALGIFQNMVNQGSEALQRIDNGAQTLGQGIISLNLTLSGATQLQDATNSVADLSQQNLQRLSQVVAQQSEVLSQYQQVFTELDKSVGALLRQIAANLETYTTSVKSGLENNLDQFDNLLGNATSRLGATVAQLSDSLDELVEASVKAKGMNG